MAAPSDDATNVTKTRIQLASQVEAMLLDFFSKERHSIMDYRLLIMRTFDSPGTRRRFLEMLAYMQDWKDFGGAHNPATDRVIPWEYLDPDINIGFQRDFRVAVFDEVSRTFAATPDIISRLAFILGQFRAGGGEDARARTEISRVLESYRKRSG